MRYILDLASGGELYVDTTYVSAVEVVDIVNVKKVKDNAFDRYGMQSHQEETCNERKGMLVHVDGEKFTCEWDGEFLEAWMDEEEGPTLS
jgi:hypothetical protein